MNKLGYLLVGFLALALVGCAGAVVDDGQDTESLSTSTPDVDRGAQPISTVPEVETCTETIGPCRIGQCELGPHDTYARVTEVCCTPSGGCTTEFYRLCGC